MNKIIILIFSIFLLFSCWKEEKIVEKTEKQDFFVETKKIKDFSNKYEIKKTWTIKSSQDIFISSKVSGEIKNIQVSFWEEVWNWQPLFTIADSDWNYALSLEKSNLWIESSKLSYSSQKISLDKRISDSRINLEKLEKDYNILIKTVNENIKSSKNRLAQTKINLEQSKTGSWITTTSNITIDKIKNNIEKAELDLENLKKSNIEQIKSFETTSKNYYINLKNLYTDIIDFSDKLLWVTFTNKDKNNRFDNYLWIKDSVFLKTVEKELLEIIDFKAKQFDETKVNFIVLEGDGKDSLNTELKINNLNFNYLDNWYPKINTFLDHLDIVLDNSIENIYFKQDEINWYKSKISWYKSNLSWKYNWFLNFKSNVEKFKNTYKNNEKSLAKQIKLLKKDLELTIKNLEVSWNIAEINFSDAEIAHNKIVLRNESALISMRTALKNAKLNLENAKKTKDITLRQLNNSIKISKNTKNLAYKNYKKLFVNSPIKWIVSEILVDKWQNVTPWTKLIKLTSLWQNEIEISLNLKELDLIKIWNDVSIKYLGKNIKWSISSISPIADKNLNYKAKISISSKIKLSWNIVEIFIPIKTNKKLIPLEILKVKGKNIWEVNTLNILEKSKNKDKSEINESDIIIKKEKINFWEFIWNKVEILWCVDLKKKQCDKLYIITNSISNFDENKFNLKIKNNDK